MCERRGGRRETKGIRGGGERTGEREKREEGRWAVIRRERERERDRGREKTGNYTMQKNSVTFL